MNRDPETFVGWAMIILALIVAAVLLAPDALADEFRWEPMPGAAPCASVKWEQVPPPLPSGEAAEAYFASCTVHSIYSEARAKQVRAAGPLSPDPTSLYDHEARHLLRAERHPVGQSAAGWGRVYGPPELDVRWVHVRPWGMP